MSKPQAVAPGRFASRLSTPLHSRGPWRRRRPCGDRRPRIVDADGADVRDDALAPDRVVTLRKAAVDAGIRVVSGRDRIEVGWAPGGETPAEDLLVEGSAARDVVGVDVEVGDVVGHRSSKLLRPGEVDMGGTSRPLYIRDRGRRSHRSSRADRESDASREDRARRSQDPPAAGCSAATTLRTTCTSCSPRRSRRPVRRRGWSR